MASHSENLKTIKNKLKQFNIKEGKNLNLLVDEDCNEEICFNNKQLVLNHIIHTADLSNPAKPYNVYSKWVNLVYEEFFNQGDLEKEKGLTVSLMCDREKTDIFKSQLGFINFIVEPTFKLMLDLNPNIKSFYSNILENLDNYKKLHHK